MKHVMPVEMPKRTVVSHTKSADYVYLTQKVEYSKDKKRSVPKRVAIGKLNDEGKLIPNQNYFELFPNEEPKCEPGNRADYISVGLHAVVASLCRQLQLDNLLKEVFGTNSDRILDLAMYMIVTSDNVMQHFEDYGYSHSLFGGDNFTDSTAGRILDNLTVKDIDLFIESWVQMNAHKDIYIAYDSTNMNCTAGNLDLAEYGHAKDNPDLPQVNLSLGYNQTDKIPLMYELYPGSIIDNTECRKMVDRAVRYGCKKVGFILDRGYFNLTNIRYFEDNGFDYILMTKGSAVFVKEAVDECGAVLKNSGTHYIGNHELYGMTLEKKLFSTDKKQYVHVYYNGIQAEREKVTFYNQLNKMDEDLKKLKEQKIKREESVNSYRKYYNLKFDDYGYFCSYRRDEKEIRKTADRLGYFVIITSKQMTAEEALDIYRDRDAVEKVFRMDKSYLGFDAFRVHSTVKLESKVFISFIALIIRNALSQKTRELYKENRKDYTVPGIIGQLERMGITKLSDNRYHSRYTLTAKQKKILKAVGMDEKKYLEFAEEVKGRIQ